MITTTRKKNYVLNKVDGDVTIRQLVDYAQRNVDTWVSEPVLWDLSDSDMIVDRTDFDAVGTSVGNIGEMVKKRRGKRTAFLAPDPYSCGMLRMAIWITESSVSHRVASVFTDVEAARAWLEGAEAPDGSDGAGPGGGE